MEQYSKEKLIAFAQNKGLYVLTPDDEDRFVECGVDAFMGYPMYNYFFDCNGEPDNSYKIKLELIMRLFFRSSPDAVFISTSKEVGCVAELMPPHLGRVPTLKYLLKGGWRLFFMKKRLKLLRRNTIVEKHTFAQKTKFTHDEDIYLSILMVKHSMQRKQLAAKLVNVIREYAQSIGRNCYLETFNPINVLIYKHLGFTPLAESQIPGTPLTHYPFLMKA